jgi:hypothetical protein
MTENEYIKAANLARLRAIDAILQQLIPGYGVSDEDVRELFNRIEQAIEKAYKAVNLEK